MKLSKGVHPSPQIYGWVALVDGSGSQSLLRREDEDLGRKVRELGKPPTKWEVYERILRVPIYVISDRYENQLQVFALDGGRYRQLDLVEPRCWVSELELELGVWQGTDQGAVGAWLRWYDQAGDWIPTPAERAEQERQRVEQQRERAEQAEQHVERAIQVQRSAIPWLAKLGLTAAQIAEALGLPVAEGEPWLQLEPGERG